jgi:hypothetical protein
MHIRVIAHGLLTVAVQDAGGMLELDVPEGRDIQGVLEILCERSPVFDPRATPIAVMEGVQVPLSQTLHNGEAVHLYPIFGGG